MNMYRNKLLRRVLRLIKSRFEYVDKRELCKLKDISEKFPYVLTTKETLERIINEQLSISRYGDAEFDICNHENLDDPYQRPSKELSNRLVEILAVEEKGFLACIPPLKTKYGDGKNYFGCLSFCGTG